MFNGQRKRYNSHGQCVQIKVMDNGAGMTQTQLEQLFSDGVQFNRNHLQAGQGSGLGLFISRGIVEQHGGCLTASSAGLGLGSTFTMTLPLYEYDPDEDGLTHSASVRKGGDIDSSSVGDSSSIDTSFSPTPRRILIVDDALMNRKMMERLLEHHGHICSQAEDGQMAVELVERAKQQQEPFDTILMDYEMPRMNGPEATKRIRQNGCNALIVGVTGNMFPEDTRTFLASGANDVLPKPFKMDALNSLWEEYDSSQSEAKRENS